MKKTVGLPICLIVVVLACGVLLLWHGVRGTGEGIDHDGSELGKDVVAKGTKAPAVVPIKSTTQQLLDRSFIRQLGESKNTNAIPLLKQAFEIHAKVAEDKADRYLDAEILLALAQIPDDEARRTLYALLRKIFMRGSSRALTHDERYTVSWTTGIRLVGLDRQRESKEFLKEIWMTDTFKMSLRSEAYHWSLLHEMETAGVRETDVIAEWLYEKHEKEGSENIEAFKENGIREVLERLGGSALPGLQKEKIKISREKGEKYWGAEWLGVMIQNLQNDVESGVVPTEWAPYWRDDYKPPEDRPLHPVM